MRSLTVWTVRPVKDYHPERKVVSKPPCFIRGYVKLWGGYVIDKCFFVLEHLLVSGTWFGSDGDIL